MNKNITKLMIPDGTEVISDEMFKDFKNLEEVYIPDSVKYIGRCAFKGCNKLKKVRLSQNLKICEAFAFANCSSLESIDIPSSLSYLSHGIFSNCRNLKYLGLHNDITFIDDYALYDCHNLTNFVIPKNCTSLGIKSLYGLKKIESLHIPKKLKSIEYGALGDMPSLKSFTIDNNHPTYSVDNGICLIKNDIETLIRYCPAAKNEEFIIGFFEDYIDEVPNPQPIYNIADYAFDGAINLKKLIMLACVDFCGSNTFRNCFNLKKLEIMPEEHSQVFLFNFRGKFNQESSSYFEDITLCDGIITLSDGISDLFKNAKKIKLPTTLENINNDVFNKSNKLKRLNIPKTIKFIAPNTIHPHTCVNIENYGIVEPGNFNTFQTKTYMPDYFYKRKKDDTHVLVLNDDSYKIQINEMSPITIFKDEIELFSKNSLDLQDNPDYLFNYLWDLFSFNPHYQELIFKSLHDKDLKRTYEKFVSDMPLVEALAIAKKKEMIRNLMSSKKKYTELLFNSHIITKCSMDEIKLLLENYTPSLQRFFNFSDYLQDGPKDERLYNDFFNNINNLVQYCNSLEDNKNYDRFLYQPAFTAYLDPLKREKIQKHLNRNVKRVFKMSETLNTPGLLGVNLNDLLKLCEVLGIFSDDPILVQKSCVFLCDTVFNKFNHDGSINSERIVGDRIHTIFDSLNPTLEINLEFIEFFKNNFKDLVKLEIEYPGIISRIYNTFPKIQDTSRRDSGQQEKKKVTLEKCKNYFLLNKIQCDDIKNKELIELISKYYDSSDVLRKAYQIYLDSLKAPRNIFAPKTIDEKGFINYNNDPKYDIKGAISSEYSYEWLPKQDLTNLILGKKCACCAHVNGAGAGIMRASMCADNCQNLVIKYNKEIFAKLTISIMEDYAVFNTIEANTSIINAPFEEIAEQIYQAFIEATNKFIESYNQNNPTKKINTITIGSHRNILENTLKTHNHEKVIPPLNALDYSEYSYLVDGKIKGNYSGDSSNNQRYVYQKK